MEAKGRSESIMLVMNGPALTSGEGAEEEDPEADPDLEDVVVVGDRALEVDLALGTVDDDEVLLEVDQDLEVDPGAVIVEADPVLTPVDLVPALTIVKDHARGLVAGSAPDLALDEEHLSGLVRGQLVVFS